PHKEASIIIIVLPSPVPAGLASDLSNVRAARAAPATGASHKGSLASRSELSLCRVHFAFFPVQFLRAQRVSRQRANPRIKTEPVTGVLPLALQLLRRSVCCYCWCDRLIVYIFSLLARYLLHLQYTHHFIHNPPFTYQYR